MVYLLQVGHTWWSAPVDAEEEAFLRGLRFAPMSAEEYLTGPIGTLVTGSASSYVLDGATLYWCVAWPPGVLVLRFSGGTIAGARAPRDEDAAHDPPYHVVYFPWDAREERDHRAQGFRKATAAQVADRDAALAPANALGAELERQLGDDREARRAWFERCRQSPWLRSDRPQ